MAKFTPTTIASLANETTALTGINGNFSTLAALVELLVSRDGLAPNTMTADFDMNSKRILNLSNASTAQEPATKAQLDAASTLTTSNASTTNYTATGGTTERTVQARLDLVRTPEDYGAVGDGDGLGGGTDDAVAMELALNSGFPVELTHGKIYLIERPLVITATRYKWFSQQSQRGANAIGHRQNYSTASIDYNPTTATDFMIDISAVLNTPYFLIGPYEHDGITFQFPNDANGLRFGDPSQEPIDATTQSYVFGVSFKNCHFHGTFADGESTSGVITRSGQELLSFTKCFELVMDNCSLVGSDYAIKTKGCDKPMFTRGRTQHCHVAFDLEGSGTFNAQHAISHWQFEGWTTSPIISRNTCTLSASDLRFEETDNRSGTGHDRYDLTAALSITASVTADSNSMTFNQAMDGILFANESLIELSNGTLTDTVLVKTVSGAAVTFYDDTSTLTWTDATANVLRIHNYGPIHNSIHDASYARISAGVGTNTPTFVYVGNRGSMTIEAALGQQGSGSGPSIAIGNFWKESGYLNQAMTFVGCSPLLMGNANHPMIFVDNFRANNGPTIPGTQRHKFGTLDQAFQIPLRKWAFIPKDTAQSSNNSNLHPFIELDGDTNTSQKIWAWNKRVGSGILLLSDDSLPAVSTQYIRIQIKAKAITGTPNLTWAFRGAGTSSTTNIALTTAWSTTEYVQLVPTEWQGTKTTDFGFRLTSEDYYCAGITVEEVNPETGWGAATGTATRTTFVTSTVTTAQLAERVKALIDDLTLQGKIGT